MRNHGCARLSIFPPLNSTHWQTLTCHVRCHPLHDQAFCTRSVPPSAAHPCKIEKQLIHCRASPVLSRDNRSLPLSLHQVHRNAQSVSPCKHCCAGSSIPSSTRRASLTLLQAPNLTLKFNSSAASAANTPSVRVHRRNSLLLRHSKRQMHAHLISCHDVNGMAYTVPLAPSSIHECADVK